MREIFFPVFILIFLLVDGRVYHPSFFSEDEISHIRSEREEGDSAPKKEENQNNAGACDEDTLVNFLAEIQVINPESVIKLATFDDLEPSCKKVQENLGKINNYLKTCVPPSQPDLYLQLIKGVESLHSKLCTQSPFRKKFQDFQKCINELANDLEDCGGPADWNEFADNAEVCKAYKDISDCYYIKTAEVCGTESATAMKELLQSIIDSILTIKCDAVKQTPKVKDAMPNNYIKKTSKGFSNQPTLLLIILGFIVALFF